jgi:CRP/FNR family transcriptional regulator, cyclic AMP receptor protein
MSDRWRPRTLLARLPSAVRVEFVRLGAVREFPPGAELFAEGAEGPQALLLLDGYVKVTSRVGGDSMLLAVRGAGDLIGDMAALSGLPRSATVTACTTVWVRFILAETLREFAYRRREAGKLISALVVEQLNAANRRRIEFATLSVPRRLARVVLELAETCGEVLPTGAIRLPRWFRQIDLAHLVGCSEDRVQHALRGLREQRVMDTGYRTVTILDPVRLADFAG